MGMGLATAALGEPAEKETPRIPRKDFGGDLGVNDAPSASGGGDPNLTAGTLLAVEGAASSELSLFSASGGAGDIFCRDGIWSSSFQPSLPEVCEARLGCCGSDGALNLVAVVASPVPCRSAGTLSWLGEDDSTLLGEAAPGESGLAWLGEPPSMRLN